MCCVLVVYLNVYFFVNVKFCEISVLSVRIVALLTI